MSKTRMQEFYPLFALLLALPLLLGSNVAVAQTTTDEPEEPAPQTPPPVAESTLEGCRDKTDNDGDGHVDCDDQDCQIYAMCVDPAKEKGPSEHTGFFLRFLLGGGGGGYKVTGDTDQLDLGPNSQDALQEFNAAGAFTLSLGGAVKENLILHGDLTSLGIVNEDGNGADAGLGVFGVGFGVTYYFMPLNLYLTGSIGYAASALQSGDDEDRDEEDHLGYGVYGMIVLGKEWMVSQNWGLGIAGQGLYSYGYNNNDNVHYNQGSFAVLFSATFN